MRPAPANGGGLWRTTTAAFSAPTFSYLWTASAMFSFAQWMERTAVGWVVLEETGSVFLTALAWALRTAPGAVIGPLAGALADRFPRQLLLGLAGLLRAIALGLLALLAATGDPPVTLILVLVMASGTGMTLNIASLQPLARDLVGPEGAMNAISINAFGQRVMGAPGALLAGFMLAGAGAAATFGAAALLMLAAGGLYLRVRPGQSQRPMQREPFRKEVADGLRVAVREPLVAALLALMIVTENLGFAFNSVLPAVAEDVMDAGSEGLGALGFAIGMGSMLGTLGLAALGDYRRKGLLLTGTVAGFGALMIALGATDLFAIGLLAAAGLGAAMAAVDALEWIILQENVADEYRGRVMGAWNVAIGLGWLGPVALGAVAAGVGVQLALVIFGAMLAAAGFAAGRTRLLRAA